MAVAFMGKPAWQNFLTTAQTGTFFIFSFYPASRYKTPRAAH
ncbi:hypothetical protein [Klebsiella pneumoniae ISC21]|nr:hypothetical protein [Klebsiella pneumoniae ISC21]